MVFGDFRCKSFFFVFFCVFYVFFIDFYDHKKLKIPQFTVKNWKNDVQKKNDAFFRKVQNMQKKREEKALFYRFIDFPIIWLSAGINDDVESDAGTWYSAVLRREERGYWTKSMSVPAVRFNASCSILCNWTSDTLPPVFIFFRERFWVLRVRRDFEILLETRLALGIWYMSTWHKV